MLRSNVFSTLVPVSKPCSREVAATNGDGDCGRSNTQCRRRRPRPIDGRHSRFRIVFLRRHGSTECFDLEAFVCDRQKSCACLATSFYFSPYYQQPYRKGRDPMVPSPEPEFPDAATTIVPVSAALLAAIAVGLSGPPLPPRLMLIT